MSIRTPKSKSTHPSNIHLLNVHSDLFSHVVAGRREEALDLKNKTGVDVNELLFMGMPLLYAYMHYTETSTTITEENCSEAFELISDLGADPNQLLNDDSMAPLLYVMQIKDGPLQYGEDILFKNTCVDVSKLPAAVLRECLIILVHRGETCYLSRFAEQLRHKGAKLHDFGLLHLAMGLCATNKQRIHSLWQFIFILLRSYAQDPNAFCLLPGAAQLDRPLHLAVRMRLDHTIVQLLLDAGANTLLHNNAGQLAIDVCDGSTKPNVYELLRQATDRHNNIKMLLGLSAYRPNTSIGRLGRDVIHEHIIRHALSTGGVEQARGRRFDDALLGIAGELRMTHTYTKERESYVHGFIHMQADELQRVAFWEYRNCKAKLGGNSSLTPEHIEWIASKFKKTPFEPTGRPSSSIFKKIDELDMELADLIKRAPTEATERSDSSSDSSSGSE